MRRNAVFWILALAAWLLSGCARPDSLTLSVWQFLPDGAPPRAIVLPAHVDRELSPSPQVYHLRTSVELPPSSRGQPLSLVIPHLWAMVALQANGQPIASDRRDWFPSYRTAGPHLFRIPAAQTLAGRLDLDLEVHHEWTQSGWLDNVPYLTSAPDAGTRYVVTRAIAEYGNLFGTGTIFTIAFAYAVLYVLDRRRTAHLWFAVQGWAAMTYGMFNVGATQALFGRYDAAVTMFFLVIAIVASMHFSRNQFRLALNVRVWTGVAALALLVAIARPGPFDATYVIARLAIVVIIFGVATQLFVVGRLALRPTPLPNARLILCSWIIIALSSANDIGAWSGLGDTLGGLRTAGLGITCFALLQSVALSRDFMGSLAKSEQLNEQLLRHVTELDAQQTAVRHLNDELRRQVLARSEQLADALTRLATSQGESVGLQEGDVVDGLYHIVRPIGAGGMGVVYEVRREGDDAHFALKVLSGLTGINELARFAREGKLAATVNHANVVRIYETSVSKKGFLFLVLELVDGQPLNRRRARYGEVPWALTVLAGIARGLSAIHAQGIVHRDMKPGNVLVGEDAAGAACEIKITDFGISNTAMVASASTSNTALHPATDPSFRRAPLPADEFGAATVAAANPARAAPPGEDPDPDTADWQMEPSAATAGAASDAPGPLTKVGVLLGTPVYMAPEILRGSRQAVTAADVYALGVVAFELLHGQRPFTQEEAMARAHGQFRGNPPSLADCAIPASLAALLEAALDVDPGARPTAAAIAEALASQENALAR